LNANVVISVQSEGETQQPGVLLNGAVRLGGVVFEADFQGADDFGGGGYRVDRNFARFVYDQPLLFVAGSWATSLRRSAADSPSSSWAGRGWRGSVGVSTPSATR
jgi:hypothetical protein